MILETSTELPVAFGNLHVVECTITLSKQNGKGWAHARNALLLLVPCQQIRQTTPVGISRRKNRRNCAHLPVFTPHHHSVFGCGFFVAPCFNNLQVAVSSTTDHNDEPAKSTRHLSFWCRTRCKTRPQNTSLLKIV